MVCATYVLKYLPNFVLQDVVTELHTRIIKATSSSAVQQLRNEVKDNNLMIFPHASSSKAMSSMCKKAGFFLEM